MNILENHNLRQLNTFGMNVQARWFAEVNNIDGLMQIGDESKQKNTSPFILGGGSNILFTQNVDRFVVKNMLKGIEKVKEDEAYIYLKAGAGEVWHEFVLHCIGNNYGGVENLSLIPGSVGAGPMQNIGAYGTELKDVFHSLEAFHLNERIIKTFTAEECDFGYRESVFKRKLKDQFFITSVTFRLTKHPKFNTSYGAIEKELEKMGVHELSVAAISQAVINIRSSKLPDPKMIGNAGSFFKNPMVSAEKHAQLKKDFPDVVSYVNGNATSSEASAGKDFKLAAGWLIEQCGWKGQRFGDAGVHKDQALVLVNYANASGKEIFDLSTQILDSVKMKFGVELEREVNIF